VFRRDDDRQGLVVDRFHVAKQFNDVVDDLRKKTITRFNAKLKRRSVLRNVETSFHVWRWNAPSGGVWQ
jgi:hypothetical protein